MISKSVEETGKMAADFVARLVANGGGQGGATIVALSGDLGSGKTTFTKALAAALGIAPETVTSPTFVIMKSFPVAGDVQAGNIKNLVHIDAYRLEKPAEIERLGWGELIANPENLILIEWPEKIGEALPQNALKISFKFVDEYTREIVFI